MSDFPQITGTQLIKALQKVGFVVTRSNGSHFQLRRDLPDGTVCTFPVPVHAGKTIGVGLLSGILRLANMSRDDLRKLL